MDLQTRSSGPKIASNPSSSQIKDGKKLGPVRSRKRKHQNRPVTKIKQEDKVNPTVKTFVIGHPPPQLKDDFSHEQLKEKILEYLNISKGSDTIKWLEMNEDHHNLVAELLREYGLSIHRYNMTSEDCNLVAKILSSCKEIKRFSFTYSVGLKELLTAIKKECGLASKLWATKVCFAGNGEGNLENLSTLYVEFVKFFQAKVLVLTNVKATYKGLEALKVTLNGAEQMEFFKNLEIFHNDIGKRECEILADIATDCWELSGISLHLSACYCNLNDGQLLAFKKRLNSTKLGGINVCGNRQLTEIGFHTLGEIVQESKAPMVTLQDCNLDAGKVRAFNLGCANQSSSLTISTLNVANNRNLGVKGIGELKNTIRDYRVENLNVASCRLTDVDFEQKFDSLDISGNSQCQNIPELATLVKEKFCMRNCMMSRSELEILASEMKEGRRRKLKEMDVRDAHMHIDREFQKSLVELFKDVTESITVAQGVTLKTSK